MKTRKAFLILAALVAGETVYGEKIAISQAPAAVQQAIRSKSTRQPIEDIDRDLRNGEITYEASWKDRNGIQQELLVSESGRILRDVIVGPSTGLANQNLTLANKVGIDLAATPQAVQNAMHNQIPNAPVDSIQRGIWNGQNIYEVTYHDNGQLKTYQVTETGQPVVSKVPATSWQPRYAGVTDANVPLSAGSKLAFNTAPRLVQNTITHMANGAQIEDFERGNWNGRTVYEAAFKRNGQNVELQVFEDGTLLTKAPQAPAGAPIAASRAPITTNAPRYAGLSQSNVQLSGSSKLPMIQAPAAVQSTINYAASGAPIEDLERGNWNGRVVYEAAFKRNGQNVELQVLDDGSILTPLPQATGAPASNTTGTGQP